MMDQWSYDFVGDDAGKSSRSAWIHVLVVHEVRRYETGIRPVVENSPTTSLDHLERFLKRSPRFGVHARDILRLRGHQDEGKRYVARP
jgi:hypothetical protein